MSLRWIKRYRVEKIPPKSGGSPLYGAKSTPAITTYRTLQEKVKVKENGKTVYRWEDLETFDDLESKEKAVEELQKQGVYVPLRVKD